MRSSVEVGKNSKIQRFRVKFEVETRVRLRSILTCRIPGGKVRPCPFVPVCPERFFFYLRFSRDKIRDNQRQLIRNLVEYFAENFRSVKIVVENILYAIYIAGSTHECDKS